MARCCVIQPFDTGKFDKRYEDSIKPAIDVTGFEAYRVDRDPAANIPIEEIERGIREAAVCLADISTNNPNVWFELGYAIASYKDVCLICSSEREGKFPFDIQHRSIIRYGVESKRDFEALERGIVERLSAIREKRQTIDSASLVSPVRKTEDLAQHEIVALVSIMQNRSTPDDVVVASAVRADMDRAGFTEIAASLGLESLRLKEMITTASEYYGNDSYTGFNITDKGVEWLMQNEDILNLRKAKDASEIHEELDDEIPF